MKFFVVALSVLVTCVNASVIPLGIAPQQLTGLLGPQQLAVSQLGLASPLGLGLTSPYGVNSLGLGIGSLGLGLSRTIVAAPQAIALQAASPVVVAQEVAPAYVAATRGATHVAPLPGHTQSVSSLNVAPAPGTW